MMLRFQNRSFAVAIFTLIVFQSFSICASAKDFDYVYINQSSYQSLNVTIGEKSSDWITLTIKNTGSKTWHKYGSGGSPVVNLGVEPKDKANWFACNGDGWASNNRISIYKNALNGSSLVKPGEQALFSFKICPNSETPAGKTKLYVTPVAEGYEWMGNPIIYWEINIIPKQETKKNYDYTYIEQSSYQNLSVRIGEKSSDLLTLTIQNTGAKTWYKSGSGSPEINLGPEPRDKTNWFACSGDGWANSNRITMYGNARNGSNTVKPGEQALFKFKLCPNDKAQTGKIKFYVTPVAEGYEWMGKAIIYWEVNVLPKLQQRQETQNRSKELTFVTANVGYLSVPAKLKTGDIPIVKSMLQDCVREPVVVFLQELSPGAEFRQATDILGDKYEIKCGNDGCTGLLKTAFKKDTMKYESGGNLGGGGFEIKAQYLLDGKIKTFINVHTASPLGDGNFAQRRGEIIKLLDRSKVLDGAGISFITAGDFNYDPYRNTKLQPDTFVLEWNKYFQNSIKVISTSDITAGSVKRTLDHVISNIKGSCSVCENSAIRVGWPGDHYPVFCTFNEQ